MSQRREQLALFAALHVANVEYVVVGGVAVNAHGFVRNTRDLDIFIRPTLENARAAFQALKVIGAPLDGLEAGDLLIDDEHYQLETANGRIDLLNFIGDITFDQVWRNHVDAEIDGTLIHFIGKADLIENKRQVGRLIDLADVERLERLPADFAPALPAETHQETKAMNVTPKRGSQ